MKKLIMIVILALLTLNINAQTFEFTSIDSTKLTKSECFTVCEKWVVDNFKTNAVLQMKDKDAGIIVVKGNFSTWIQNGFAKVDYRVDFKITIQIKDYKIKIVMSDFDNNAEYTSDGKSHPWYGGLLNDEKPDCGGLYMTKNMWAEIKSQSEKQAKETLENLRNTVKNGVSQDNW